MQGTKLLFLQQPHPIESLFISPRANYLANEQGVIAQGKGIHHLALQVAKARFDPRGADALGLQNSQLRDLKLVHIPTRQRPADVHFFYQGWTRYVEYELLAIFDYVMREMYVIDRDSYQRRMVADRHIP
jgi:hypothetical protein